MDNSTAKATDTAAVDMVSMIMMMRRRKRRRMLIRRRLRWTIMKIVLI